MERKVVDIVINDGLDCLLMCAGQGRGGNFFEGAIEGGPATVEDTRRYSITRPLISRAATSHPIALQVDHNTAPRSLNNGNPTPSYYPSEAYKVSIEALEQKNGASQMIQ